MKKSILVLLSAIAMTSSMALAGETECYKSTEDSALLVCISDLEKSEGTGYSNLEGRGVATVFDWMRTTKNILISEADRNTGEYTGCESGVTIVDDVMTVENLSGECGVLSGKYVKVTADTCEK